MPPEEPRNPQPRPDWTRLTNSIASLNRIIPAAYTDGMAQMSESMRYTAEQAGAYQQAMEAAERAHYDRRLYEAVMTPEPRSVRTTPMPTFNVTTPWTTSVTTSNGTATTSSTDTPAPPHSNPIGPEPLARQLHNQLSRWDRTRNANNAYHTVRNVHVNYGTGEDIITAIQRHGGEADSSTVTLGTPSVAKMLSEGFGIKLNPGLLRAVTAMVTYYSARATKVANANARRSERTATRLQSEVNDLERQVSDLTRRVADDEVTAKWEAAKAAAQAWSETSTEDPTVRLAAFRAFHAVLLDTATTAAAEAAVQEAVDTANGEAPVLQPF